MDGTRGGIPRGGGGRLRFHVIQISSSEIAEREREREREVKYIERAILRDILRREREETTKERQRERERDGERMFCFIGIWRRWQGKVEEEMEKKDIGK